MSRSVIYRCDFTTRPSGGPVHKIRVLAIPSHTSAYVGTPSVVDLPFHVFDNAAGIKGERKFPSGLPVGLPQDGGLKFKLDLMALASSSNTDVRDFAAYAVTPETSGGGNFTFSTGSYTRLYDTSMVWTFLSDEGLGGAYTKVLYIGVQETQKEKLLEPDKHGQYLWEVSLEHIAHWVCRTIITQDVNAWMFTLTPDAGPHHLIYSEAYEVPTAFSYLVAHGALDKDIYSYRLAKFFNGINTLMNSVFQTVLRRFSGHSAHIESEFTATPDPVTGPSPFDHWTLHAHTHLADADYASTDTPTTIPRTGRYIAGSVNPTGTTTDVVAGFFTPNTADKQNGLIGWLTLWDYLADVTEYAVAKGTFRVTVSGDNYTMILKFYRLFSPLDAGSPLALSPDDFTGKPAVKIDAYRQGGAKGGLAGSIADDAKITQGSDVGPQWASPSGFHNSRMMYRDNDRFYNDITSLPELARDYAHTVMLRTTYINYHLLLYLTAANGIFSSPRLLRVHHYAKVDLGDGTSYDLYYGGDPLPTPAPSAVPVDDPATSETNFGTPYKDAVAGQQEAQSMPMLGAFIMSNKFNHHNQTEYGGEVGLAIVSPDDVGDIIAAASFADGNTFVEGLTFLGDLPGTPVVNGIQFDIATGEARVTAFAQKP